jgi:predicted DNA-binding transcriptional regulator AlpA
MAYTQNLTLEQVPSFLVKMANELQTIKELLHKSHEQNLAEIEPPIDVSGAAAFVRMDEQTIYRLVRAKKIPFHKKSKLYFYKSELNDWIRSGKGKTVQELELDAESELLEANKRRG